MKGYGKGWFGQSKRHSIAKRFGAAEVANSESNIFESVESVISNARGVYESSVGLTVGAEGAPNTLIQIGKDSTVFVFTDTVVGNYLLVTSYSIGVKNKVKDKRLFKILKDFGIKHNYTTIEKRFK